MRKQGLAFAAVSIVVASSAAYADDFSGLRRFDGFYLGVNAGASLSNTDLSATPSGTYFSPTIVHGASNASVVAAAGAQSSFHSNRFTGGAQAGYNLRLGDVVLGFETDFENFSTGVRKSVRGLYPNAAPGNGFSLDQSTSTDWLATARPRIGWVSGRSLLYLTGGLAVTQLRYQENFSDSFGASENSSGSKTNIMLGWTAGAGAEYAVSRRWSVKAEYLYADFGNLTRTGNLFIGTASAGEQFRHNVDLTANIVRVGLNYHFNVPAEQFVEPPMAPAPMRVAAPVPPPLPTGHEFIVFFDFDRSTLTPEARRVVEVAAQYAKEHGAATLQVVGYTDLSGGFDYNMRLSQARAQTVARYLERLGINRNEIVESWHGKENPRVPTPDGVREPQNRRVEISME